MNSLMRSYVYKPDMGEEIEDVVIIFRFCAMVEKTTPVKINP